MIREIKLPEIGENIESGDVLKVLVAPGDSVKAEQALIELETEKAVVEVPSPAAGVITEIMVKPGDSIAIGQVIAKIEIAAEGEAEPAEAKAQAEPAEAKTQAEPVADEPASSPEPEGDQESREAAPAAPSVRRLAHQLGADINKVQGTGPGSRITAEDVMSHVKRIVEVAGAWSAPAAASFKLPDFSRWGEVSVEPMSKVRKLTARNTAGAWSEIPHVTQFDEADISELMDFTDAYGRQVQEAGGKLTVTAIVLKVAAAALRRFPRFNASLDSENQQIVHKHYVHIGVAVATEWGLLVPVIRDADKKGILDLSVELTQIVKRARSRQLTQSELEGGTFTVSNQGGIGGVGFSPIVFWPQAAILGVSAASTKPVYVNERLVPRTILPVSLSYDHRINDGADAAHFLSWFVKALRHPFLLSFE